MTAEFKKAWEKALEGSGRRWQLVQAALDLDDSELHDCSEDALEKLLEKKNGVKATGSQIPQSGDMDNDAQVDSILKNHGKKYGVRCVKCHKIGKVRTIDVQIRAADEGTSMRAQCGLCGHRWIVHT